MTADDTFQLPPLDQATVGTFTHAGLARFHGALMLAKVIRAYLVPFSSSSLTLTDGSKAIKPSPNWDTSASWTSAKKALTRGLAVDLAPIRINCVTPGIVDTAFVGKVTGDTREDFLGLAAQKTLTKAIGKPEDLAEAYLYLMRDRNVTGQVMHSNGGYFLV